MNTATSTQNSSPDIQTAIRQVQKLLKLANHANTNAEESAAAAARAQDIMTRFKISNMVAISDDSTESKEEIINFGALGAHLTDEGEKKISRWKSWLAMILADSNGCKIYQGRKTHQRMSNGYPVHSTTMTLEIIGRSSDVDIVRYLFSYLSNEVDRLTKSHGKGCGRVWCNNFRLGVVEAIKTKLVTQAEETKSAIRREAQVAMSSVALVRVDNALARIELEKQELDAWVHQNMRLGKGSAGTYRSDAGAREAGRQAGSKLSLNSSRGGLASGNKALKD